MGANTAVTGPGGGAAADATGDRAVVVTPATNTNVSHPAAKRLRDLMSVQRRPMVATALALAVSSVAVEGDDRLVFEAGHQRAVHLDVHIEDGPLAVRVKLPDHDRMDVGRRDGGCQRV